MDNQIRILDLEKGKVIKGITGGSGDIWKIVYSPDGAHIAAGSQHGAVNIYNVEKETRVTSIETDGKFVMSVAYVRSYFIHVFFIKCSRKIMNMSIRSLLMENKWPVDDMMASFKYLMSRLKKKCIN